MNGIAKKSMMWNLWHGCHKLSAGCKHCYVYRGDAKRDVDSSVVVTVENQSCADYRLPIYKSTPIKHKIIICEPLLEKIDLSSYNIGEWIEQVVAGGESGYEARPCDFDWVMELRRVCMENHVSFWFKQTGSQFINDGKLYTIKRQFQHSQAHKAGINIEY